MTTTFIELFTGADAGDAFLASAYADMADYPPTGIGQKHGFVQIAPRRDETARETAQRLVDDEDSPVFGTDAPAGCIAISEGEFLLFGWARVDRRRAGRFDGRNLQAA